MSKYSTLAFYLVIPTLLLLNFSVGFTQSFAAETERDGTILETERDGGVGVSDERSRTMNRSVTVNNPLKAKSITAFFIDLIEVVLVFATPVIVFFIILAGFKFVLARGNPEKVSEASKALLFAVIGGLLILGAFVILNVIQGTIEAITV